MSITAIPPPIELLMKNDISVIAAHTNMDCAAKGISRAVIAVDRAVERVVEFEFLIHYENHLMLPFLGLVGGYVDKTNGVVSPM